jgi:fatty-acyl-CoA synthase
MKPVQAWIRALQYTKDANGQTLPGLIDDLAAQFATRPLFCETGYTIGYIGFARRVNRYARWAEARGIGGRVVGLMMPNSIDYVALWLALTRIGCTVALLNTNLRGEALRHSMRVAGSHCHGGPDP